MSSSTISRSRARRARGISLVEIMLSILVLAIAMLGMMKAASVAVHSNVRGQRIEQAATRAQTRLEALKNVPTVTLQCLANGSSPASCHGGCVSAGGETDVCSVALALDAEAGQDSTGAQYSYGYLVSVPAPNVYDILVVASFRDDSTKPARQVRSLFRTAVYRTQ